MTLGCLFLITAVSVPCRSTLGFILALHIRKICINQADRFLINKPAIHGGLGGLHAPSTCALFCSVMTPRADQEVI